MDEIFALVQREIERQNDLWGADQIDDGYIWLSRLLEEAGEAAKANNERNAHQYIVELSHVAAVAIQAIHSLRLEMAKKS